LAWSDGHADVLKKEELRMAHGGHGAKDGWLMTAWCREWRVESNIPT